MKYFYCVFIIALLFGCDDIIEPDISNKEIEIISPQDMLKSTNSTLNFLWNTVDGSLEYQLEVVKGRFDSIVKYELDTFISQNKFTYTFDPGKYEWSLRAFNGSSSTSFKVRAFEIDSSNNLFGSSVILKFPLGGIYSDSILTFSWNKVFSANQYVIQIEESQNGNLLVIDTAESNSYSIKIAFDSKNYNWKVKAINSQSESNFSLSHFEIDLLAPDIPTLNSPANQTTTFIGPRVNFIWQNGVDKNWSYDSLYLYKDLITSNPFKYKISANTFTSDTLQTGNYFWRVKSFDVVDNSSSFSETRSFKIQ